MSLNYLISVLTKAFYVLNNQPDDDEATTKCLLLYWQTVAPYYQSHPGLIPDYEYRLLYSVLNTKNEVTILDFIELVEPLMEIIELIDKNTKDGVKKEKHEFSQILNKIFQLLIAQVTEISQSKGVQIQGAHVLNGLVTALIQVNDFLLNTDPNHHTDRIMIIQKAFKKITQKNFSNTRAETKINSSTGLFFQSALGSTIRFEESDPITNHYLFTPTSLMFAKSKPEPINLIFPETISEMFNIYFQVHKTLPYTYLVQASRFIYSKTSNKIEFLHEFLTTLQRLYQQEPKTQDRILQEITTIFSFFLQKLFTPLVLNQTLLELNFDLPKKIIRDEAHDSLQSEFQGRLQLCKQGILSHPCEETFILRKGGRAFSYELGIVSTINLAKIEDDVTNNPRMPLFIKLMYSKLSEKAQKQFLHLIDYLEKSNAGVPEEQNQNFLVFLLQHQFAIITVIEIMDIEGIIYLKQCVAETLLPLDRKLKLLEIGNGLPNEFATLLKKFFADLGPNKTSADLELFYNCTTILLLLANLMSQELPKLTSIFSAKSIQKLPDLFQSLAKMLLIQLLGQKDSEISDEAIQKALSRFNSQQLTELMSATIKMSNDEYQQVYLNLLKCDFFSSEVELDKLLHDTTQKNPLSRGIALHNQAIQTQLDNNSISPKDALQYPKKLDFMIPSSAISTSQKTAQGTELITLWSYIEELVRHIPADKDEAFKHSNLEDKQAQITALNKIKNTCSKLAKKIAEEPGNPKGDAIINAFNKDPAQRLIARILTDIKILKLESTDSENLRLFKEFAQHVQDQKQLADQIKQQSSKSLPKNLLSKDQYFRVVQWDKKDYTTFFLGNRVGCCLATTGMAFSAMVQRRLDDSMLFHVVIDQNRKTPVALIWLYLAQTADKKTILIANFFEVNTKYAQNEEIRLALLNALLEFTHQYCQDNPGIDSFYMSPPRYGWNMNDLGDYPLVPLSLKDKLGGPFIPELIKAEDDWEELNAEDLLCLTDEIYYLSSLANKQFLQFDPKIFNQRKQGAYKHIDDIIQVTVKHLFQTEQLSNPEEMIQRVITSHRAILTPFYQEPLESNDKLQEMVTETMEKEIALLASEGETDSMARFVLSEKYHQLMLFKPPEAEKNDENPDKKLPPTKTN